MNKVSTDGFKRYYFWKYDNYGWRQIGRMDGYETFNQCRADNKFYINEKYNYMILEGLPLLIRD